MSARRRASRLPFTLALAALTGLTARAAADGWPPAPGPEPDDVPTPVVRLTVRVAATATAGQELEYRLCVENPSRGAAHHVLVRNPVPAHAKFVRASPEPHAKEPELLWKLNTLEPGAKCEITLVLAATGTGDVQNCARVVFEHGQCVTTKIARPVLSVRKTGPTQATVGETLTFQITVTNTGDAEATGVMLTDTLPPGLVHSTGRNQLTWEVGKLLPGQSATVEYQAVAQTAGRLANKVTVTGAGDLKAEQETAVTVAEPKLSLGMTGPAQRALTLAATYQITVTNPGTVPLADVILDNPIPPQAVFVSASAGGNLTAGQVQWLLGTLEPGASRTVEVELRAQERGRLCNRAVATGARGVTARAEFCTDFTGDAGVLLEVVDTEDPVEVNAATRYVITVRNQGQLPLTNVVVAATVPPQLALTRATGPADHRPDGPRVVFDPVTIPAEREARYEVEVRALQPGDARFKVELTADQLRAGGPVHEEESTTVVRDLPAARRKPRR
jgi:uncharacterized repeat protein (TIGR01451 family)